MDIRILERRRSRNLSGETTPKALGGCDESEEDIVFLEDMPAQKRGMRRQIREAATLTHLREDVTQVGDVRDVCAL